MFPKYEFFDKQYHNSSLRDYETFLHLELLRNQDEGNIIDIQQFKENSRLFWEEEKQKVEPNQRIINLFLANNIVLDEYIIDKNKTNFKKGKQIQVLQNIHRQFEIYEKVALENALAADNLVSFQTFNKLPSLTKKEYTIIHKGTQDEFQMKQFENIQLNKLILETKDIYRRFFTSIPGLRKEVNNILSKIAQINIPDVYDNDQQRWCQSFGSHHIFRFYADKVKLCIDRLKDEMKTIYECPCGSKLLFKNKLHHERTGLKHNLYNKNNLLKIHC
jgi:DNA-directed RNA polymerase subunit RPC12/RpoP